MPASTTSGPQLVSASSRARMSLANVISGVVPKPLRVLVYGLDGVGKSTLAACAESPIFLGTEDGTNTLDVKRFPQPESWLDVLAAVDELTHAEHSYRTLVVDSLDWLEPICWAHTLLHVKDKNGKTYARIEDVPFNRGYISALDDWRVLLARLDRLRDKRATQVVFIAHSWIKSFKNPAGEDFDRFEIKLHAKAAGLVREWCDAVLFATYEQYTRETDAGRVKGVSTGARILQTERSAAWDAKNRFDLPPTLPLDWGSLREAIAVHQTASPDELRRRIASLLANAGDDLRARVTQAVERVGDNASELARIANKLAAQASIEEGTHDNAVS